MATSVAPVVRLIELPSPQLHDDLDCLYHNLLYSWNNPWMELPCIKVFPPTDYGHGSRGNFFQWLCREKGLEVGAPGDATHLLLDGACGGMIDYGGDTEEAATMLRWMALDSFNTQQKDMRRLGNCVVEKKSTPHFPMFFDLDVACLSYQDTATVPEWGSFLANGVSDLVGRPVVYRLATAAPRPKNDVFKNGAHLHVSVVVTQAVAMRVRKELLGRLQEKDPRDPGFWGEVVDKTVILDNGLRMLYQCKATNCPTCKELGFHRLKRRRCSKQAADERQCGCDECKRVSMEKARHGCVGKERDYRGMYRPKSVGVAGLWKGGARVATVFPVERAKDMWSHSVRCDVLGITPGSARALCAAVDESRCLGQDHLAEVADRIDHAEVQARATLKKKRRKKSKESAAGGGGSEATSALGGTERCPFDTSQEYLSTLSALPKRATREVSAALGKGLERLLGAKEVKQRFNKGEGLAWDRTPTLLSFRNQTEYHVCFYTPADTLCIRRGSGHTSNRRRYVVRFLHVEQKMVIEQQCTADGCKNGAGGEQTCLSLGYEKRLIRAMAKELGWDPASASNNRSALGGDLSMWS